MAMIDELRAAQLDARKVNDKVKAALLTTLIGEVTKVPAAKKLGVDENNQPIFEKVEADLSDAKVLSAIDAMLKGAVATKDALENEFQRVMGHPSTDGKTRPLSDEGREFMERVVPKMRQTDREIEILSAYKPSQLTDGELQETISNFRAANPGANIGQIMAHLKANYAGRYDGKRASELAKG